MAAIKVYEAKTLVSAMEKRAKQYEELKEQLNQLKKQFLDIVNSGDEFQGKGAEAIKGFYSAQVDVVEAWMRLIDKNIAFFKGIPGDAEDAKLSGDTFVQMSFIEENVPRAQNRAKEMVHSQQDALQSIFRSIDDLVPLHVFSTDTFEDHMAKAEKERTQTIDAVNQLDQALTEEYAISENDQSYLVGLFGQLLESSRQGSTITPINFDAKAYQNSEIYKMKKDIENSSKEYLSFKSDQAEARKQAKIAEELENRPWYEKLWDTTKTFTGEVSGYYDYKRATEGVDPVTGEKLTDAQRIAAGAMAAAGFIPVVGWAGRAAKGGSAIYKTLKAYNAADHALDAYRTSKSFSTLQKTEMGIYGLVSANGLGEAVTGKDMFGNQLTEEQRNQSLFNAFAILGVAGAGYGIDRLASRKVPTTMPPYSNKYVQEKLAVAQHTLKTIGSRIGDLPVPVKVNVQEMRTNTGFGVKQVYVETKSVRDVMQMSSSGRLEGKDISQKTLEQDHIIKSEYKLKPNIKYISNGYDYSTDSVGRINNAKGKLQLGEGKRNSTHQIKSGGKDRKQNDHGGHLIAHIFGGSGLVDNIVPMNGKLVNQGSYKKLEIEWRNALREGQEVYVDITPKYKGDSLRPREFVVKYTVDGKEIRIRLSNP